MLFVDFMIYKEKVETNLWRYWRSYWWVYPKEAILHNKKTVDMYDRECLKY